MTKRPRQTDDAAPLRRFEADFAEILLCVTDHGPDQIGIAKVKNLRQGRLRTDGNDRLVVVEELLSVERLDAQRFGILEITAPMHDLHAETGQQQPTTGRPQALA